mgnify:CR=1 FL=1
MRHLASSSASCRRSVGLKLSIYGLRGKDVRVFAGPPRAGGGTDPWAYFDAYAKSARGPPGPAAGVTYQHHAICEQGRRKRWPRSRGTAPTTLDFDHLSQTGRLLVLPAEPHKEGTNATIYRRRRRTWLDSPPQMRWQARAAKSCSWSNRSTWGPRHHAARSRIPFESRAARAAAGRRGRADAASMGKYHFRAIRPTRVPRRS